MFNKLSGAAKKSIRLVSLSPYQIAAKMTLVSTPRRRKRVLFVHLDLGIGGAEQLVVSAASGLQQRGTNAQLQHQWRRLTRHAQPQPPVEHGDHLVRVRVRVGVRVGHSWLG